MFSLIFPKNITNSGENFENVIAFYAMVFEGLYVAENVIRASIVLIYVIHEESSNVNLFKFLIFSGLDQVAGNTELTRFIKASK